MTRRAVLAVVALVALAACGKKGPPVPPEVRVPRAVSDLTGVIENGAIVLGWNNPSHRVDNTRIRELSVGHVFRHEDAGLGEPKPAMLVRGRIAGYTEIARVPLTGVAPASAADDQVRIQGTRVRYVDRAGLTIDHRYTYVVTTEDFDGRSSPPSSRLTLVFLSPPESPTELQAAAGDRQVQLTWKPPERLADGSPLTSPLTYEVLRAAAPGAPATVVTPAPRAEPSFTDENLENDHTYSYTVRAIRTQGTTTVKGPLAPRIAATPIKTTPPRPPSDLIATPTGATVRLSWRPSPDPDVATYIVYRALSQGAFERIASTRAPVATFVDQNVASGSYRYAVTAQDSTARANESARSPEVTVTVP